MFVTGEGRVGLAYHSDFINGIRAGGVVVSLFGINLPFVLRPDDSTSHYHMVNVAYLND
jgi:hypothetical protein